LHLTGKDTEDKNMDSCLTKAVKIERKLESKLGSANPSFVGMTATSS
jgi:hypothetical protein